MAYQHGIYIQERDTAVAIPKQSLATIAVAIGTAPVNLVDNPVINKPILATSYDEAVAAIGYSDDWDSYTLCQVVRAFFREFKAGPLVLINILDPKIHKSSSKTDTFNIADKKVKIEIQGVLLDNTFIVKDNQLSTTYTKDTDYSVAFDVDGYPVISILDNGKIPNTATQLDVSYVKLDSSKVTENDVIGSYDEDTNIYKGIECVTQVYPMFNLVPGILIAPGYSQIRDVELALRNKSSLINGSYNSLFIVDIDSSEAKTRKAAIAWKAEKGYTDKREVVVWPKIKIEDKIYWYSAYLAALIVYVDIQNDDVPFKSPSNEKITMSATVLKDGTEVYLDQMQANELNAHGILTAVNIAGWRTWGNNTAIYPATSDPKDRFIAVRRVFDWWGNSFIVDFFDKVDDPTNYRLIESIVDEENVKANGYQAAGQIAGAKISFNQVDNPINNILNGKIVFKQTIGAFTPAENIINVLEFDPTAISKALFGGDN